MENNVSYGYAPIHAENGMMWVDQCHGETQHRFKIYDTEEAAALHRVNPDDKIARVKIEILQ